MIRSLLFALIVGFCASSAFAQWLPGHDYVLDRAGNVIHVRGPTITTPDFLPKAGTGSVVPYRVTGTATGAVITSQKAIQIANQRAVIEAAKTIPWKNVAIGVARTARITPYSMAAGFAVEWLIDNGWRYTKCLESSSACDGEVQWQKKDVPASNQIGNPNFDYQSTLSSAPWRSTPREAAADAKAWFDSVQGTGPNYAIWRDWRCIDSGCSRIQVDMRSPNEVSSGKGPWQGSISEYWLNLRGKQLPLVEPVWVDSPPPDFDKNPPAAPDPGKAPDIWDDALPGGIPDSDGGPSVSGPASVPGPSSTTTKTDGSTVTTNTVNNFTYNNNNSTVTVTTTTTTTTTAPNGSTSSEQTTEDGKPEPEESVLPPRDPDMPEVPTLYEKKYPDGPSGVWATRKAQLQTTPIFSFLASLVPSTGDGGCPSWQLPVMYGIKNTSVGDISIPCWIWSAIRAIFIVTALLSCRRIIFGG